MPKAKGIQAHPHFKLGKAEAKRDPRNLKFAAVLRAKVPPVPKRYDFDVAHPVIPTPMFGNDELGDCVIAGRAHQTLRFEKLEQGKLIQISDTDVRREYFTETGGADSGLVVLDSISRWRKKGWRVNGKPYTISAYAEIDPKDHAQFRRAIYADCGVGIGLRLPKSAQHQLDAGDAWDVANGPSGRPNSWGGHYVYISGYTPDGPVCVTWGRKQRMTWAFLDRYCDEAYAIFDAKDRFRKSIVAKDRIAAFLETVTPVSPTGGARRAGAHRTRARKAARVARRVRQPA